MNKIREFENTDFGNLTVIEKDGEIYFIGNEVAKILGYANYRKAVMVHIDDEDKLRFQIVYYGQIRNLTLINESVFYSLIMASRLPQAKKYKHWVTSEVLPSIRKNGGYFKGQESLSDEEILERAMALANNLIS